MCSCNKHECTDDFVSLPHEHELNSQEASWRTPVGQIIEDSYDEYCSPACATPATPRTPVSARREFRTPVAPLRLLSQRRDLRQGVALASRRLNSGRKLQVFLSGNSTRVSCLLRGSKLECSLKRWNKEQRTIKNTFETRRTTNTSSNKHLEAVATGDSTFDSLDTDDSTGSSQRIIRDMFRCAPSSTLQTLPPPQTRTGKLAQTSYRLRTRPLPPERQYLPRIARMTPCGKCLRI